MSWRRADLLLFAVGDLYETKANRFAAGGICLHRARVKLIAEIRDVRRTDGVYLSAVHWFAPRK